MRRTVFFAVLVVCMAFVFACKSQPKTTEEALKSIYDRYKKDLILDGAEKYTVESGDNLSAISRAKYDSGFYFPVIMLASSDVVQDYDLIEPGMELTIPDLQKNLENPRARKNIKNYLIDVAKIEEDRERPENAKGFRDLANSL